MNLIHLKNVIPTYLSDNLNTSEVYGKDLIIKENQFIHIVAPSGSGKTSLTHICYGINKDFTGELLINDSKVNSLEEWSEIRRSEISVIFQDLRLIQNISALENIVLKNQLTNHKDIDDINRMAEQLGVYSKLNQITKNLSRGEQQRIAIIRSLCMPFNVILMDEPFSHLDEQNRLKSAELILYNAKKNNASIIMANLEMDDYFDYSQTLKL